MKITPLWPQPRPDADGKGNKLCAQCGGQLWKPGPNAEISYFCGDGNGGCGREVEATKYPRCPIPDCGYDAALATTTLPYADVCNHCDQPWEGGYMENVGPLPADIFDTMMKMIERWEPLFESSDDILESLDNAIAILKKRSSSQPLPDRYDDTALLISVLIAAGGGFTTVTSGPESVRIVAFIVTVLAFLQIYGQTATPAKRVKGWQDLETRMSQVRSDIADGVYRINKSIRAVQDSSTKSERTAARSSFENLVRAFEGRMDDATRLREEMEAKKSLVVTNLQARR